jgi:uroporphyrin-III C-methyltransferase/precorrin-2 dehydrogenase/sirohydrochlorin ferrochelatase
VAVIARATLPDEHAMVTTLDELPAAATGIAGPAIVVIGEVVRLADLARTGRAIAEAA